MRATDYLEKLIKRYFIVVKAGIATSTEMDRRILDDALSAYEKSEDMKARKHELNISKTIMKNRIIRITAAAMIVVAFGVFLLPGDGEKGLIAKAAEALKQARTCHVVIKEYRDGQWFKDQEIWYDREAGIIEQERYKDRTDIRIDNEQYEWRYTEGNEYVVQLKSYRKEELVKDLTGEWLQFDPNREPSGDKAINGVPCEMYTLSGSSEKVRIWVDRQNRVRQFEAIQQRFGQESQMRSAIIEYDIVVDQELFRPKFDSNVKVINPRQWIEELFPLDTAIFKRNSLGFIFAVHESERCENGAKYLVCSNRLNDATRQEISSGHPWTYYGESQLFSRWQTVADNGYTDRPVLLARMTHDGIQVLWYVLLPAGNKAEQVPGSTDVDVRVNTANQLEEKLKTEGLPTLDKFRLRIPTRESKKELLSLREIAGRIFSLGKQFDPIIHSFLLTKVITKQDEEKSIIWKRPLIELSEDEFVKDIERRVEEWLESNG